MSIQQTILFAHIASGTIALIAGAAALIFRKGARLHRQTGNIFFVSMLAMSATGAYLAYTIGVTLSIVSGILTFYLTATAWMTVKRKPGEIDALEYGAFVVVLAVTVACFALAVNARSPAAAGFYYFFGGVAAIAAIMDIRMLIRQGVSGVQRIVRHLWRMCFAMFMATMAFFLGQARHLPDFIRETHLNVLPVVAVVLVMFFWLFYAFFSKRYKHTGVSRGNYHAETI